MDYKAELEKKRLGIDDVDQEIIKLFSKRMSLSEEIAEIKRDGNIGLTDPNREREVVRKALEGSPEDIRSEAAILFNTLMSLSKMKQKKSLMGTKAVNFPTASPKKSGTARVAYQGVPGAWGEQGALTIYPQGDLKNYEYFEDVFVGVTNGESDYGVVPIENSQTGAIGEVYDLLRKYGCYIVGQSWIDIKHCLMGIPGAKMSDIREVYSHTEGFKQCHNFLKGKAWDTNICRNTAVAAQMVAAQGDPRCAAIASERAAKINGLELLNNVIVDSANNRTRFIAIAAAPEYDSTSNVVSVTFSAPHISGSLCAILNAFMVAGINMSRIESRPAGVGKYRFFADLEANLMNGDVMRAVEQAAMLCDYFEILGCYK